MRSTTARGPTSGAPPLHDAERPGCAGPLCRTQTRGGTAGSGAIYIMSIPPMPPGMPAAAPCFSGASATIASVVRMFFAIDAAF
jgi:hypothetical protein